MKRKGRENKKKYKKHTSKFAKLLNVFFKLCYFFFYARVQKILEEIATTKMIMHWIKQRSQGFCFYV
jgi:hypothetical protein